LMTRRTSSSLHRLALFLVVLSIAVIGSGAFITSTEVAALQSHSAVSRGFDDPLHRALAAALILFTLGLALWTSFAMITGWVRLAAWSGFAALAAAAALGWRTPPLSPVPGVLHALLSHLFLSLRAAIAVGTSSGWNRDPERVDGSGRPLLRPLAAAIPPIVLLQITLGAMYRHDVTSVVPHIGVAMAVALLALVGSSMILQNFPRPASLRRAAAALIAIVLVQVSLGVASFVMLVLNYAGTSWFVVATVGHVSVGAATLAAGVVMAMQVWRSVDPNKGNPANT
jgi:heme a synthase